MRPIVVLLATLVVAPFAVSQVEVVEPGVRHGAAAPQRSARTPAQPAAASGELFYQLQLLQDEVMKLRGIVEEQGEQLRQLKQQRLDDYISLDRRISGIGGGSVPPVQDSPGTTAPGPVTSGAPIDASAALVPPAPRAAASAQGEQAYRDAYALIQARKFPEARTAFNAFVGQYPDGSYAGNAHYWLGELYLLDGDSERARKHFETLLAQFGDNRRVPDAMFKLGRIYHQSGDTARARDMLDRVINEYAGADSTAPQQAREYLQQNF